MLCNENGDSLVVLSPMQIIHANAAHFNLHASDFRSDRTETYNAGFITASRSYTSCDTQVNSFSSNNRPFPLLEFIANVVASSFTPDIKNKKSHKDASSSNL